MVQKDILNSIRELIKSNVDLTEATVKMQEELDQQYKEICQQMLYIKDVIYRIQSKFKAF